MRLLIIALLFINTAFALPLTSKTLVAPYEKFPDLSLSVTGEVDLSGTVDLLNCSGAIVNLGSSLSSKAIILTNGHCAGFPKPGEFISNRKWEKKNIKIYTDNNVKVVANVTKIIYSTLTGTDVALLETDITYEALQLVDAKIFKLASEAPRRSDGFYFISGYHRFVKDCYVDDIVGELREHGYVWLQSIRYDKDCKSVPGSSGSPLVSKATGEIIAINNTHYDGGAQCSLNNPCEVDEMGNISVVDDASYGQQTVGILECVDEKGIFNLNLETCPLTK